MILFHLMEGVGRLAGGSVVGNLGLGERNEKGDKWVEYCEAWAQAILIT